MAVWADVHIYFLYNCASDGVQHWRGSCARSGEGALNPKPGAVSAGPERGRGRERGAGGALQHRRPPRPPAGRRVPQA